MNLAALPNWAIGLLVFLLFVVAPAASPLMGPTESDAAQAVAEDLIDAPSDQRVAMKE